MMISYRVVIIPLANLLLLVSLSIPWVVIDFQGDWFYTPIDIAEDIVGQNRGPENEASKPNFITFTTVTQEVSYDLVLSMITYFVSTAVMMASIVALWNKRWSKIMLLAGILSLIGAIAWIDAIYSFKAASIERGIQESLINAIVITGFGPYLTAVAGTIAIFGYMLEKTSDKRDQQKRHPASFKV